MTASDLGDILDPDDTPVDLAYRGATQLVEIV